MKHKNQMLSQYMKNLNRVAVDFDGTLTIDGVTLCKGAKKYIVKIHNLGVNLILWTCRCDDRYDYAKQKIKEWSLPIDFIEDYELDKPRKLHAIYTIDDRSVPGGKINWYRTYRYIKKEIKRIKECE